MNALSSLYSAPTPTAPSSALRDRDSKLTVTEVVSYGVTWSVGSTYHRQANFATAQYDVSVLLINAVDEATQEVYDIKIRGIVIPILVLMNREVSDEDIKTMRSTMVKALLRQCTIGNKFTHLFNENDRFLMEHEVKPCDMSKLGSYVMVVFHNSNFARVFLECMLNQSEELRAQLFGEAFRKATCYYRRTLGDGKSNEIKITTIDDNVMKRILANQLRIDNENPSFTTIEINVNRTRLKEPFFWKPVLTSVSPNGFSHQGLFDQSRLLLYNDNTSAYDGQMTNFSSTVTFLPDRYEMLRSNANSMSDSSSATSVLTSTEHVSIVDELSRSSADLPPNTIFLNAQDIANKIRTEFRPASTVLLAMQNKEKKQQSSATTTTNQKKKSGLSSSTSSFDIAQNEDDKKDKKKKKANTKKRKQTNGGDTTTLVAFLNRKASPGAKPTNNTGTKLAKTTETLIASTETESANDIELSAVATKDTPTPTTETQQPKKNKKPVKPKSAAKKTASKKPSSAWDIALDEQALRDFFL